MKDMLQRRATTHTSQKHLPGSSSSSSSASVGSSSSGSGGSGSGSSGSGSGGSGSSGSSSGGSGGGVWQTVPSSNVSPTDDHPSNQHQSNPHQSNPDQPNPAQPQPQPPPVSYPNTDAVSNTLAIAKSLTMTLLPQAQVAPLPSPPLPSQPQLQPPSPPQQQLSVQLPKKTEITEITEEIKENGGIEKNKKTEPLLYLAPDDDLISPLILPEEEVIPFATMAISEFSADLPPVVTIFSAPNYCDRYENKAAILRIDVTLEAFRVIQVDTHTLLIFY